MLSDGLRAKLREALQRNPKEVVKMIEEEPRILQALLNSDEEIIKYINMSAQMEQELKQKAEQLKTTQGFLIGAGVLLLLDLLSKD